MSGINNRGSQRAGGGWRGPILILAAAVLWSSGGLGIKTLDLSPLTIAGWRSAFTIPILLAACSRQAVTLTSLRRRSIAAIALFYAVSVILFVSSTRLTTAANAILLQYTSPLWVLVLSRPLLHERPRGRDKFVAAVCLAGLALFFLDKLTPEGTLGMALAVGNGFTMACLILALRHEARRGVGSASMAAVFFGNALCILLCSPWMVAGIEAVSTRGWFIIAALGTLQVGLAYVLFSSGLRQVTALRATLIGLVEPLLNPLWVWLGNGEVPGSWALAGGAVIIGSLVADTVTRNLPGKTRAPVPFNQ